MKKGPFSTFSTFSAGVFLFFRPRLFRISPTMHTRSQTRKAQEQASSSASCGDHFDTPHAGFGVAADMQPSMLLARDSVSHSVSLDSPLHTKSASSSCVLPPVPVDCLEAWGHSVVSSAGLAAAFEEQLFQEAMDTRVLTPFPLDTPLHNGSTPPSTMSPLVLEGVQGVPRPERPTPFPRRHLLDPRIKRKLDKVLTRFAPVSSSRTHGAFKVRSSPFTPSTTMAILSRVDAQLHIQDQIAAFRHRSATVSSSGSSSNDSSVYSQTSLGPLPANQHTQL
jgi:hypothetical protein